ncbi:RxLR-like protein [Plasmopara halstedii]|uniref:RxLR-like protein n=1 Tax=Plasmopara halstedii TaxID=4781 RepID=A0A0P1ART3_PLAHL|nr:RxLR-like protein [Plasmopara halstedii]CEG44105.1 RxLR-like protein [Plasmopara halstedii]|eukprot:XP_024580474.1 RxLR-like protein [Plasmopara halstedii]
MKVTSAFAAISAAVASVIVDAGHSSRNLILGGDVVPIGTKRYTAMIFDPNEELICSGVLVSSLHLLTTAWCAGSDRNDRIPTNVTLEFSTKIFSHDLALLTLDSPSAITPIKLPKNDDSDITYGLVTKAVGWGETSFPDGELSDELRGVNVSVWTNDECIRIFLDLDNSYVCAGGTPGKGVCHHDYGSPLIKESELGESEDIVVGLHSLSVQCGVAGQPSLHARVSAGVDWIRKEIGV